MRVAQIRAVLAACAVAVLAACGDSGSPGPGKTTSIGPEGGLVEGEGISLSVPAGALTGTVDLRILVGDVGAPEVAERVRISKVFQIVPETTRFLVPATVTVRWEPERLPTNVATSAADVRRTDFTRAQERLASVLVNADAQTVSGEALSLGTFWATMPAGPRPARITVTPASRVVYKGDKVKFSVEVRDQTDRLMPGQEVVWTTANEAVATIDAGGLATALAPGVTDVTARAGSAQGKATLQVAGTDPFPQAFAWENPLPQGNALHAVRGDADRVLVGGANGTLAVKTATGWTNLYSSRGTVFHDVALLPTEAYATGSREGQGTVLRWDGTRASELKVPDTELQSLWFSGGRGMAVGAGPNLAMTDASGAWTVAPSPVTEALLGVDGSSGDPVVVGARGAVYKYASGAWMALSSSPLPQLQLRAVVRGTEAFAISETSLRRFSGGTWSAVALPAQPALRLTALGFAGEALVLAGVAADGAAHLLVAGEAGFTDHLLSKETVTAVWGRSATDLYAVTDGGSIQVWNGESWRELREGSTAPIVSIAAFAGPRVFAAANRCADEACSGLKGVVIERDANGRVAEVTAPFATELKAIGGRSAEDVWAVGASGMAYRRKDGAWAAVPLAGVPALYSIASCSHGLYAGGLGKIYLEKSGTWSSAASGGYSAWKSVACFDRGVFGVADYSILKVEDNRGVILNPQDDNLRSAAWRAVWSTPDGIAFIGGDARYILQWTGAKFVAHDQPADLPIASVRAIWGTSFGSVWAGGVLQGGAGFLVHFNGAYWQSVDPGFDNGVSALQGLEGGDLWIGGPGGALLHGSVGP